MERKMKKAFLLLFPLILTVGCGPDVKGTWDGSGEFFPGKVFSIVLKVGDVATAEFTDMQGHTRNIVVCDLRYDKDSRMVSFAFDPSSQTQDCASLDNIYRFKGTMGYGVIAGELLGLDDKSVGRLRALKRLE